MARSVRIVILVLALVTALVPGLPAKGQESGDQTLSLRFRRNFGFGLGGQMQGKFTIRVEGPDDLARVAFLLDGQVIGEDDEAPFSLAFDTGDYAEGIHRFSAIGYTAGGEQLQSDIVSRQFVTAGATVIVVVAIVALVIVFRVASYFLARRAGVRRGAYGYLGGAVCPNCGQAFGIHWWSLRLGFGRLDRCPHCGKWHMANRASEEALAAADELHGDGRPASPAGDKEGEEEAFRRRLEDSRYDQS